MFTYLVFTANFGKTNEQLILFIINVLSLDIEHYNYKDYLCPRNGVVDGFLA